MEKEISKEQLDALVELCKMPQKDSEEGRFMSVQEALERLRENRKKVVDTK